MNRDLRLLYHEAGSRLLRELEVRGTTNARDHAEGLGVAIEVLERARKAAVEASLAPEGPSRG